MFSQSFTPANRIHISTSALVDNFSFFQRKNPSALLAPVIKSNAYGHGLVEVAKIIDTHIKPPYVCVDNFQEAQALKAAKINTPILVMGIDNLDNLTILKKNPPTLTVCDVDTLHTLNTKFPGTKIHVKIDTGMNRLGLKLDQLEMFIAQARRAENLIFEGIWTHLAQASKSTGDSFTNQQLATFNQAIKVFRHYGFLFKWRHAGNTAGVARIKSADFNLGRLGLGLYGYSPFPKHSSLGSMHAKQLRPVLSCLSKLVHIKSIKAGEQVSYDGTFIASKPMTIGIIPIGYYDGLDPRLSNRGIVYYDHEACPILGKVCMNMTVIDLSQVTNPTIGHDIEVISNNPEHKNTVWHLAKTAQLTPHHILSGLNPLLTRYVMRNTK